MQFFILKKQNQFLNRLFIKKMKFMFQVAFNLQIYFKRGRNSQELLLNIVQLMQQLLKILRVWTKSNIQQC